jgi:hypothetical protein
MKDPTCPFLSHKLPPDINEVAYVIAKINKYGNIDDYAEKLIREDIEKRRRKRNDTDDSFKQYIDSVLLLSSSSPSNKAPPDDDSAKEDGDDYEDISVTLRLKNFAHVLRLLVNYYDEGDMDKFLSEEVSKVILTLVEASLLSTAMSDELKQQMQSHLNDEKI